MRGFAELLFRNSGIGPGISSSLSLSPKVAVQIDLERYDAVREDFFDALTLEQRKNDPPEPFEAVEKRLVKQGKLSG